MTEKQLDSIFLRMRRKAISVSKEELDQLTDEERDNLIARFLEARKENFGRMLGLYIDLADLGDAMDKYMEV